MLNFAVTSMMRGGNVPWICNPGEVQCVLIVKFKYSVVSKIIISIALYLRLQQTQTAYFMYVPSLLTPVPAP